MEDRTLSSHWPQSRPLMQSLMQIGVTRDQDSLMSVIMILTILACMSALFWTLRNLGHSKTSLIPGVLVVGGSDRASIERNSLRFVTDSKRMLIEGYENSPQKLYYVPTKLGPRLMIPASYVEFIKNAPDNDADFFATFAEMFESKYTTMGSPSTLHPRTTKAQLNRYLPEIMDALQAEIVKTFAEDFPPCVTWTSVALVETITYNVARVASRMFGGEELSDNSDWVKSSIGYATDGFIGAQALKQYPSVFRPFAKHFIPAIAKIHEHNRIAEAAVVPILERRERTGEKASDLLYWMTQEARGAEKDHRFLAAILLKISFAAMHTTAAELAQIIFDLCAIPEYVQPLREEIATVVNTAGFVGKNDFSKLALMDSFMKESQRLNPLVLVTFERYLRKDVRLPDGTVIPARTTVGVPAHAITMDAAIYPTPDQFDGYRYLRLKKAYPDDVGKFSFASTNHTSMGFGYGKHACPGRFFATNEIKAMLVHILTHYDFKLPEGYSRPQSLIVETQNLPNHSAKVMFHKRNKSC